MQHKRRTLPLLRRSLGFFYEARTILTAATSLPARLVAEVLLDISRSALIFIIDCCIWQMATVRSLLQRVHSAILGLESGKLKPQHDGDFVTYLVLQDVAISCKNTFACAGEGVWLGDTPE